MKELYLVLFGFKFCAHHVKKKVQNELGKFCCFTLELTPVANLSSTSKIGMFTKAIFSQFSETFRCNYFQAHSKTILMVLTVV